MDLYLKNQGKWNEIEQKRLSETIKDDIEAASLQLELLEQRKEELIEENKDLEFRYNELEAELEAQTADDRSLLEDSQENNNGDSNQTDDQNTGENQPKTGTFFTVYSKFEEELAEEQGRLEATNNLRAELKHRLNKLKSLNASLKAQLEIESHSYSEEAPVVEDLKNICLDITSQCEIKKNELIQVSEASDIAKEQVKQLADEIYRTVDEEPKQLQETLRNEKAILDKCLKQEEELEKEVKITARNIKSSEDDLANSIAKQNTTKHWQADRTNLLAQIKRLKIQIQTEQSHQQSNEKTLAELESRFKKLLGSSDSNCPRAKALCLAEIEDLNAAPSHEEIVDAKAESEYEEELKRREKILAQSLKVFDNFRMQQLSQLDSEYEGSTGTGYINLLRTELAELQAQLTKL